MAAATWYYRLDGKPHGPFTDEQFEKLIRGRTVNLETDVSVDGHTWKSLRETLAAAASEAPDATTLLPGDVKLPKFTRPDENP